MIHFSYAINLTKKHDASECSMRKWIVQWTICNLSMATNKIRCNTWYYGNVYVNYRCFMPFVYGSRFTQRNEREPNPTLIGRTSLNCNEFYVTFTKQTSCCISAVELNHTKCTRKKSFIKNCVSFVSKQNTENIYTSKFHNA